MSYFCGEAYRQEFYSKCTRELQKLHQSTPNVPAPVTCKSPELSPFQLPSSSESHPIWMGTFDFENLRADKTVESVHRA